MAIDWSKLVYTNTATPYLDSYKKLANQYNEQAKTDIANMNTRQTEDLNKSNAGYDNTARQNYINYMQAQKKLPSQLNAMGIRGGASESSLVRLGTNYGTNVASNETARQTAANEIRNAYAQQIADYNKSLNERLAQAEATAQQNQIQWEREQLEKDLQYFSGAIEGLYSDKSSYQKLIDQLKASKDPNKDYKIMLATRAMNMLAGSGSGSGGGGGYSRSRSYGGYGGSNDTEEVNNTKTPNALSLAMQEYAKKNYKRSSMNRSTNDKTPTKKKYNWDYNIKGISSSKYYPKR